MKTYKHKSTHPEFKDIDIQKGCYPSSFMTFERAINQDPYYSQHKDRIIGYRVTEQGIIVIYKD